MNAYSIVIITITVIHVILSAEFAADKAGLLFRSTCIFYYNTQSVKYQQRETDV